MIKNLNVESEIKIESTIDNQEFSVFGKYWLHLVEFLDIFLGLNVKPVIEKYFE